MLSFLQDGARFHFRVAGVIIRDGAVLVHRASTDPFWALPGGRAEMGERAEDALRREMREEIDAEVAVDRLLWVVENFFDYAGERHHEIGFYFLASIADDDPVLKAGEVFEGIEGELTLVYRWWPLDRINDCFIKPSFLSSRLRSIGDGVEHIIHDERENLPSRQALVR